MNKEYIPLYRGARDAAKMADELELWARSLAENIACAKTIEKAIRSCYDGYRMDKDAARHVIDMFGYDRVNWVLAATVQQGGHDGMISEGNKKWTNAFHMPNHRTETIDYRVDSNSGLLNLFIDQARQAWQELGLFSRGHCLPDSRGMDYDGKVLVLHPDMLKDGNKSPSRQLVLAAGEYDDGSVFPRHRVRGTFIHNGEKCEFDRSDFIGVLNDIHMPWWAPEKLADLSQQQDNTGQQQERTGDEQRLDPSM